MPNHVVNVVLTTYNQETLVSRAIDSVLNQVTDFPYNLIIGEDCSLDGTLDVCKRYVEDNPGKIILIHSDTNVGLIKNYQRCFKECDADLIAILEGDDYWTDIYKLQKQVSEFAKDATLGLVHTNYQPLFHESNKLGDISRASLNRKIACQGHNQFVNILRQNFICSITVMFKREVLNEIDFDYFDEAGCNTVDYIIWLQLSQKFSILYMDHKTAVYRISNFSISNSNNFEKTLKFNDTKLKIAKYYLTKFPSSELEYTTFESALNAIVFLKACRTLNFGFAINLLSKVNPTGILNALRLWRNS